LPEFTAEEEVTVRVLTEKLRRCIEALDEAANRRRRAEALAAASLTALGLSRRDTGSLLDLSPSQVGAALLRAK